MSVLMNISGTEIQSACCHEISMHACIRRAAASLCASRRKVTRTSHECPY
jgi:hypothetical protein